MLYVFFQGIGGEIDEEVEEGVQDETQVRVRSPTSTSSDHSARPATAPASSQPSRPPSGIHSRPSTARGEVGRSRQIHPPHMKEYPPFSVGIEEVFALFIYQDGFVNLISAIY